VCLTLLLLSLTAGFAQGPVSAGSGNAGFTRSIVLYAPAVARSGGGALIQVNLTLKYPGSGLVYFSAKPLVELDTQATARVAAFVAAAITSHSDVVVVVVVVVTSNSGRYESRYPRCCLCIQLYKGFSGEVYETATRVL